MSKEEDPEAQTGPQPLLTPRPQHLQVQQHVPWMVTIRNEKINESDLGALRLP